MSASRKYCFYEYDKQIAAAFKVDCEEFLEEFEKLKSLKFSDFSRVWQLKSFTFVFSGQKYALLLRELCENYFYIVKKFFMLPRNIFTQVGAFYLLYGLYYKQPLKGWVKIRLTLEEYKKITELIKYMKSQKQNEPVYIFAKMKTDQAFVYTALPKPLGPEERFVKSYVTYLDYTFTSSKGEDTLQKFNEEIRDGDLIKEMEKTNDEYQELLKKYAERCPSLAPFQSDILKDLHEACAEVEHGESTSRYKLPSPEPVEWQVKRTRSSVREKAMANKHAVYRGNRKVKTAVDIDFGDSVSDNSSDFDDDM